VEEHTFARRRGIHINKVRHHGDRLSTDALVFRYAQEKLAAARVVRLVGPGSSSTSGLLGKFHCISAQNRQLLRNTIIKEKLKDFKLLQILLRLAGSCGLKVWGSSSFPRLLGFVPGSYHTLMAAE
jgi:hypothetical protein